MRYGIISDIHGNLEAFEVAIDALSHEKIDQYLCVGDIVGYGADPAECISRTKALNSITIAGNHDRASGGLVDISFFNEAARQAIIWTQNRLSEANIAFLNGLKLVYKNQYLTLVHGTLQEPEAFHYMFDKKSASLTFGLMDTKICFVGHSHIPGIFSCKSNTVKYFHEEELKISKDEKLIVNIGSIGQPRDGDFRLCYSVYDTEKNLIKLKRLPYDVKKAQGKIIDRDLPAFLAYRLAQGV